MTGFAQIMRDTTDFLLAKQDRVGLDVLIALVNRIDARLVTDIGGYRLGENTGHGQAIVERKLEQFVEWGWVRLRVSFDPYRQNPILLKMVAPDLIAPVSEKCKAEVLRQWNEDFSDDKSLVAGYRQRYRLNDSQSTPKQNPNANPNKNQTTSLDQRFESEGQRKNPDPAHHYTQEEIEDFESSAAAHYSLAESTPVGGNGVARNDPEGKSSDISDVSVADLTIRVRDAAPALKADEIHTLILNHGGKTVQTVLDMMQASKKPIQKPAGYIKSMCTRLSGKAKAQNFDPLDGQSYLVGKYSHLFNS